MKFIPLLELQWRCTTGIEIKVMKQLGPNEKAQLLNYLKATGLRLGLLLNFGSPGKLEWKWMIK